MGSSAGSLLPSSISHGMQELSCHFPIVVLMVMIPMKILLQLRDNVDGGVMMPMSTASIIWQNNNCEVAIMLLLRDVDGCGGVMTMGMMTMTMMTMMMMMMMMVVMVMVMIRKMLLLLLLMMMMSAASIMGLRAFPCARSRTPLATINAGQEG